YTNASSIIQEGFHDAEDLGGLFSGYHGDGQTGHYHAKEGRWGYAAQGDPEPDESWVEGTPLYQMHREQLGMHGHSIDTGPMSHPGPRREMTVHGHGETLDDPTLQHPRCVFQILKRHFARYTPEIVADVCGCTPAEFETVAKHLCDNSGR